MRTSLSSVSVVSLLLLAALACSSQSEPSAAGGGAGAKPAQVGKEDPAAGKALLDAALAAAKERGTQALVEFYDPT